MKRREKLICTMLLLVFCSCILGVGCNENSISYLENESSLITTNSNTTTTTNITTTSETKATTTTTSAISLVTTNNQLWSETEINEVLYANSTANIRKGPGVNYPIMITLSKNSELKIVAKCSNGWYKLQTNNQYGYISETLISKTKTIDSLVINEKPSTTTTVKSSNPAKINVKTPEVYSFDFNQIISTKSQMVNLKDYILTTGVTVVVIKVSSLDFYNECSYILFEIGLKSFSTGYKTENGFTICELELEVDREFLIKRAFIENDTSKLDTISIEIYNKTIEVINTCTNEYNTDYENELAIHDYLILNTKYDYQNYLNGSIPNESYEIYGCLIKGTSVCSGYAKTFKYLMDILGIEALYITGTANNSMNDGYNEHAWNAVKLDGEWYWVDVTWDDPLNMPDSYKRYDYFNVTDTQLFVNHIPNKYTSFIPKCTATKYKYS